MSDDRALLTALYRAAVEGAAPFARTRDAVRDWLSTALRHDGPAIEAPIHCIALGKAAPAMMQGALAALAAAGRRAASGAVICAEAPSAIHWRDDIRPALPPDGLMIAQGDHPVPGPASLEAAERLEDHLRAIEPGAVAIVLLSGGTTALCAAPIARLSQEAGDAERAQAHLANLAQTLLESGLAIHEMNAIRRRVLRFGAGRLAVALAQRGVAQIGTFAISDVIGDDPAVIGSGPCTADTLDDAALLALIDAHELRPRLERAVATVLGLEGGAPAVDVPSPTAPAFARVQYTLVARNQDALAAMARDAETRGLRIVVDEDPLAAEAATVGDALARRALAMASGTSAGTPMVLLCGGEPVVHLRDTIARAMRDGDEDDARLAAYGNAAPVLQGMQSSADEPLRGGRMQVLALSAALTLEAAAHRGHPEAWRIMLLAAGTDGRDGPTDAAGAIVDAAVPALARRARRIPEKDLHTGHSWFSLQEAGALLHTGLTGTNAMDVVAVLIR